MKDILSQSFWFALFLGILRVVHSLLCLYSLLWAGSLRSEALAIMLLRKHCCIFKTEKLIVKLGLVVLAFNNIPQETGGSRLWDQPGLYMSSRTDYVSKTEPNKEEMFLGLGRQGSVVCWWKNIYLAYTWLWTQFLASKKKNNVYCFQHQLGKIYTILWK